MGLGQVPLVGIPKRAQGTKEINGERITFDVVFVEEISPAALQQIANVMAQVVYPLAKQAALDALAEFFSNKDLPDNS